LVANDGKLYEPEDEGRKRRAELAKKIDVQQIHPENFKSIKKRTVKDLPGEPHVINAVSVVFMYTLLGLGDREIADILKTDVKEIHDIRMHGTYVECFQIIHSEFVNANSDLLSSRIAAYSQDALTTVGELAKAGKKEEVRLRASTDLLDRAGVRAKDMEAKSGVNKGGLRITIVDGEKTTKLEVDTGFNE
jgi:hypothetical protein